jgi:uncharacterized protein YcgI (DUF1989 family)
MPLLLVEPDQGPLPPETDLDVPAGTAVTLLVGRGQMFVIEAPDGGQVAGLFAWTAADPAEWLSPHHTRVFGGTFLLRTGTRLVTNRRRPIFVVGRDSLRRHDLLLPASDETVAAVRSALAAAGVTVPRIPDPVNLFMDARLSEDGQIDVRPSPARPGERWTVRALIDAHVAVAATRTGILQASSDPPRRLRVIVRNEVADLLPDLPLATR